MLAPADCPIPAGLATLKPRLFAAWSAAESAPNVFRYRLHVQHEKTLPGRFGFLAQLNPDRTTKRRPPQSLLAVRTPFNPTEFNFNAIHPAELLFEQQHRGACISFLVNNSPLTANHTLICPDRAACHPQVLDTSSIRLAVELLHSFGDRSVRIGYNSPGAWASVNHLHLHLLLVEQELYVERVPLEPLVAGGLCRIGGDRPVDGFGFEVANADDLIEVRSAQVGRLVRLLCDRNIPHNLVWTLASGTDAPLVRIFVFPKARASATKEFSSFNIAFCELAGYVPLGNGAEYERLTEEAVRRKMQEDVGDVCQRLAEDVAQLWANEGD